MKEIWKNLTRKQIVLAITAAVSLMMFLILTVVSAHMRKGLETQNMAGRWSEDGGVSQVSCFFSQNAAVDVNTIKAFEHSLDAALMEASIVSESPNANARLWADAYSSNAKLTLLSAGSKAEVNVIGVGGDFFLFHPLQLISGSYFSESDLMQDKIIVDEDTAWQLFGSNDIVGQQVTIDGVIHLISGVIKRDSGRLNDMAGNGSSIVYVSYDTLQKNLAEKGQKAIINHYEVVMPNPVKDFAPGIVKEKIGVPENETEIVENTTRFGLVPLLQIIGNFGMRSMNGKAIIYPYWENMARGYEDILSFILVLRILFVLYPIVILMILLVYLWKHRTWHYADVRNFIERKCEDLRIKIQNRKDNPKKNSKRREFDYEE